MVSDQLGQELRKLRLGKGLDRSRLAASSAVLAALGCSSQESDRAEARLREAVDALADERQRAAVRNAYALGDSRSWASVGTVERRRRFARKARRSESSVYQDEERGLDALAIVFASPVRTSTIFATRIRAEVTDCRVRLITIDDAVRNADGSTVERQRQVQAQLAVGGHNVLLFLSDNVPREKVVLSACFHGTVPPDVILSHYEDIYHWTAHNSVWSRRYELAKAETFKEFSFVPRADYLYVLAWDWTPALSGPSEPLHDDGIEPVSSHD